MRRLLFAATAAAALAVASLPARAGMFDDDEARKRIEDVRQQLADTNKRVELLGRNQLDFANQMETLKSDISRLNGQVEVLTYELEAAQKRQKDFYVDLDNRLRKLETPAEAKPEAPKADPAAETAAYEAAVTALKASQFRPAADAFNAFILKFPASGLLASAHYWAGYAHSQLKEHARAAEMFGKFAAGWPADERAPGALESQVSSLELAKDMKGARAAMETLAEKYPATEPGKRAKARLKKK